MLFGTQAKRGLANHFAYLFCSTGRNFQNFKRYPPLIPVERLLSHHAVVIVIIIVIIRVIIIIIVDSTRPSPLNP